MINVLIHKTTDEDLVWASCKTGGIFFCADTQFGALPCLKELNKKIKDHTGVGLFEALNNRIEFLEDHQLRMAIVICFLFLVTGLLAIILSL